MLTLSKADMARLSTTPILTRGQVAALTDSALASVEAWTRGPNPVVQKPRRAGWSPYSVGFAGLLESDVLHLLAGMNLPPRRAARVVRAMREDYGQLALVERPGLFTDGTDLFLKDGEDLTRTRDLQGAFEPVLERFLSRLVVRNGRAEEYMPEQMPFASVSPFYNGGALTLMASRVPVAAIAGMLKAGEGPHTVAADYEVELHEVLEIERNLEWAWEASSV